MDQTSNSGRYINSNIGKTQLDETGSAIGAARMDPAKAYGAVPQLLKEYIDSGREDIWKEIRQRIDEVYIAVSTALEALDTAEPFSGEVTRSLESGKKLFFKPNLVSLPEIDFQTHSPVLIGTCLPWAFQAAVMRWFHDQRGVSYHKMALGEAGTFDSLAAFTASKIWGTPTNVQTVIEGKKGDKYGGWGFYFSRKYLAECHDPSHTDDPMRGYEESLAGHSLPPGKVTDKLLIYDLNKIADDMSNGREVPVADGINFKSITIHKAVVGGDPKQPEDIRDWPGCFLVNISKLKIHVMELYTAAIKNLGVGLYPMEANTSHEPGKYRWKYALPNLQIPMLKMTLPHTRWTVHTDEETGEPIRDSHGKYIWTRTGGMEVIIADMLQAIKGQGVRMLHIVDAIETTNINHSGPGAAPVPEGFVFAGNDMVAVDTLAARYLFTTVPSAEIDEIRKEYHLTSDIIREVPLPGIEGVDIINEEGYDSPFSRYGALKHCEDRGLGKRQFYVVGRDLWVSGNMASYKQRIGAVYGDMFTELLTTTLYQASNIPLWDLQATCLAYLEADDKLTGSNHKKQVMEAFDENGDGVIDYLETGKGEGPLLATYALNLQTQSLAPDETLKLRFLIATSQLKRSRKEWNLEGHNIGESSILAQVLSRAYSMSNARTEMPDPLYPGRTWGKGKWPSFQMAMHRQIASRIYGMTFPDRFDILMAPYGQAFRYADLRWNSGKYCASQALANNDDIIGAYHKAAAGGAARLPFTFYVPRGYGSIYDVKIPNVEETENPGLIFTAGFKDEEVWRDLHLSEFNLK